MKSFLKLMAISMQGRMYYRTSFFLNLITPVVLLTGQFLLWGSLYGLENGGDIGSMPQRDLFAFLLVAFAMNNLLTWSSENSLSREIRSGTIVSRCLRPMYFLSQNLAEMTGSLLLQGSVNFSVVVLGFLLFHGHLRTPAPLSILLFLPCLLLGTLLRMLLVDLFSLLCFFTTSNLGISWTRRALFEFFSGALIPVSMFPGWLKSITYATPFPYMLQAPIDVLLGRPLSAALPVVFLLQLIWLGIFLLLHCLLFGKIRKNMAIAGG